MPPTDVFILKALLQSNSEYVSGNRLATELGISRVGVWARLEKLREEQFEVEAVRHRGYRLIQEPPCLHENLVRAYLALADSDPELIFEQEVSSTNTIAERELAAGRDTPFAVLAQRQTQGRGRLGRRWHSDDQGNLYSSLAFRPNLPPAQLQTITLWMGVQICDYINSNYGVNLKVKWPNDLTAEGRKVSGILTEARVDADRTRDMVFGIGINVNGRCKEWPPEVAAVATSLAEMVGEPLRLNKVAAGLIMTVMRAYEQYISGEYRDGFQDIWDRYDALRGRTVNAMKGQTPISGVADGVDEHGNLRLLADDGSVQLVHAGEVSIGTRPDNA